VLCVVEGSSDDSVLTTSSCRGPWLSSDWQWVVACFHWDVNGRWRSSHCARSTSCRLYSGKYYPVKSSLKLLVGIRKDVKESVISPLLKKSTIDKDELYQCLTFLWYLKVTERVVKSRLIDHLTSNKLLNPQNQSAYCKHHSTETALLYIHEHLINAIGSQKYHTLHHVHHLSQYSDLFPFPWPPPLRRWYSALFLFSPTQLWPKHFSPSDRSSKSSSWMTANLLTLNSSKTEFLHIRLKNQLAKIHNSSLDTSHTARNLGFIFDEHLTFSDQIIFQLSILPQELILIKF